MLYDWITTRILPLFWTVPTTAAMTCFDNMFMLVLGGTIIYWTVYLPFYLIRTVARMPKFFPWGDKR